MPSRITKADKAQIIQEAAYAYKNALRHLRAYAETQNRERETLFLEWKALIKGMKKVSSITEMMDVDDILGDMLHELGRMSWGSIPIPPE